MRAAPSPRRTDGRPPFLFYPLTLRRIKKSAENRKNVGKKVYICTVETKHRLDYDNETREIQTAETPDKQTTGSVGRATEADGKGRGQVKKRETEQLSD